MRTSPQLRALQVSGATIVARRDKDGAIDLGFDMGTPDTANRDLPDIIETIDAALLTDGLATLEQVVIKEALLFFRDERANRIWRADGGLLTIENGAQRLELRASFDLEGGRIESSIASQKGSRAAQFSARMNNVQISDLATQSDLLGWLKPVDVALSFSVR